MESLPEVLGLQLHLRIVCHAVVFLGLLGAKNPPGGRVFRVSEQGQERVGPVVHDGRVGSVVGQAERVEVGMERHPWRGQEGVESHSLRTQQQWQALFLVLEK